MIDNPSDLRGSSSAVKQVVTQNLTLVEDVRITWQERGSLAHRRKVHTELSGERLQRLLAHCVHFHPHTHRAVQDPQKSSVRD